MTEHSSKRAEFPTDKPVSRGLGLLRPLEKFPPKITIPKYLHPEPEKGYPIEGEKRKEDLAPSLPPKLEDKKRKENHKVTIDHFSGKNLDLFENVIANSPLASLFGLSAEKKDPSPEVPSEAPALWSKRTTGREVSPVDFIKQHYGITAPDGSWDSQGMTRAQLKKLDSSLYAAYASWIRPGRHPEDKLNLPENDAHNRIQDPEEAIERRRASVRAYNQRRKR